MESLQQVKSRMGAVKNIGQITKAMEVVSATKMRKAQILAIESRPYAYAALGALADLLRYAPEHLLEKSVLVQERKVKKSLTVLVASDRGLAGAFNGNVIRQFENLGVGHLSEEVSYILVGKKLAGFAKRKGLNVVGTFTGFGDFASHEETAPLTKLIVEGYLRGDWDEVTVLSTHFKSTLSQVVLTREILPMHLDLIRDTVREIIPVAGKFSHIHNKIVNGPEKEELTSYIFEPSPEVVLDKLLPELLQMQILHLLLEANASEHSARMVAMKNASENSKELAENLNLEFNKARQALITKEMIEITSAQTALS
jgi:F-type H+-transporting ATPase subunit gamma